QESGVTEEEKQPLETPSSATEEAVRDWLLARLAAWLGLDPTAINVHEPLSHHGLVSRDAVRLVGELEDWLGRPLSPVLVYQYPTVAALARHLSGSESAAAASVNPQSAIGNPQSGEPIAVVGVGCRFPGADGPSAFWRLLCDGVDAVTEVPPDRWDLRG